MLKILTITLITSLSIIIAVIINEWLLLPLIVSLYFLTKKFLSGTKIISTAIDPVLRFAFFLTAAVFVTQVLSIFFSLLILLTYLLGWNADKKCKEPSEITNIIACGLFGASSNFYDKSKKITDTLLPITNAMSPKVNIKIQLPDGAIQPAKLTHSAVVDKNIKPGDTLFLTCGINPKLDFDGYSYAKCTLILPKTASIHSYFPEELNAQFNWSFGANFQGMTDPQTLILSRPLVWPPNNATQTHNSK
ncbi:MAG: hypothetical protein ABIO88_16220 [Burkholderiaceae bacterium]